MCGVEGNRGVSPARSPILNPIITALVFFLFFLVSAASDEAEGSHFYLSVEQLCAHTLRGLVSPGYASLACEECPSTANRFP